MRTILALLLTVGVGFSAYAAEITAAQPTLPTAPLVIDTPKGPARFTVEMAVTFNQQETAFWMKNTLIPLDMLFIKANGTIARIAANAKPLSEETIPSYEPVRAVLEIPGGRAAQLGLKAGETVHAAIFGNLGK